MKFSIGLACFMAAVQLGSAPVHAADDAALPEIKPLKREMPRYPSRALDDEMAGDAIVRVEIDDQGKLIASSILYEMPEDYSFGTAAATSVKKYKFQSGQAGTYQVKTRFRLLSAPTIKAADLKNLKNLAHVSPAPQPIKYNEPTYPRLAELVGYEADIKVIVEIVDGRIVRGVLVSPDDFAEESDTVSLFGDSVFEAIRRWRFEETVNGTFSIIVPFTLAGLAEGKFKSQR